MWIIFCRCKSWQRVRISLISGGRCSNCDRYYDRKGRPVQSDDDLALDDFLSELSDDDAVGFIQSECDSSFGPEVN